MRRTAVGDATGVVMPASVADLREAPEAFLTRAMHAYGSLGPDNRVATVDRLEVFSGGNSGQKALLDVTYAQADADLPRQLFAKFSRDFEDPFRDRRRAEIDGEVRLAALSRLPGFPVAVPRPVFADFEAASGSGLIGCAQVTEIRSTPGVQFAGVLPREFESATFYAAAIASRAEQPQAARLLIDMLAAPDTAPLRRAGGFD